MNPALPVAKAALRAQVLAQVRRLSVADRGAASKALCDRFNQVQALTVARCLLGFAPTASEPDIAPLMKSALATGKRVALPGYDAGTREYSARYIQNPATDLVPGKFGILEPHSSCETAPLNRLDLVLVPGVAFDARGWRLGRGRGFYDRLLASVRGTTCGVAFDEQIVPAVPVEPHDVRLTCILTPTRLIET